MITSISVNKIQRWLGAPQKPIARNGASVKELALLRELFKKYGMSDSRFYNRAQYVGFDAWEIMGIDRCINEYVEMVNEEIRTGKRQTDENTEPITLTATMSAQDFRQLLSERGLLTDFYNYMSLQGMSQKTTAIRIADGNFAEWEMRGVESIYQECKENKS